MQNFEILSEMDDALSQAEISAEKGRHMAYQVHGSMSGCKGDFEKLYCHNKHCIMSDIAFDYAVKVEEELEKVRKLYDKLFKKCREEREDVHE